MSVRLGAGFPTAVSVVLGVCEHPPFFKLWHKHMLLQAEGLLSE